MCLVDLQNYSESIVDQNRDRISRIGLVISFLADLRRLCFYLGVRTVALRKHVTVHDGQTRDVHDKY